MASPGWFSQFYPRMDMLELPFLVTDWDQAQRMLSSQAFQDLAKAAEEETDILIYGKFPYGFRNIANSKRSVETLEDLKGLKLRVQNSPAHLATFQALGASPVALAWDETYQAVQTGVVELELAEAAPSDRELRLLTPARIAQFVVETRNLLLDADHRRPAVC